MIKKYFGSDLKNQRILTGHSPEWMAFRLNLSLSSYLSLESGNSELPFFVSDFAFSLFGEDYIIPDSRHFALNDFLDGVVCPYPY